MRKLFAVLGNIKMTTTIAALVLVAIIGSIAAVSGAIYMSLHAQSIADSEVQQETNLAVAATILGICRPPRRSRSRHAGAPQNVSELRPWGRRPVRCALERDRCGWQGPESRNRGPPGRGHPTGAPVGRRGRRTIRTVR